MSAPLRLRWRRLWAAKQGNAAEDYEDAGAGDPARGRFAVADGASEASFAGVWARLLVESFLRAGGKPWRELDWIAPLRREWAAQVDELPLPWYAEGKRELGAFATFLGLVIRRRSGESEGDWRALAVGDCCLFHTRGGRVVRAFPLTRSEDFGNRPTMLRSRPRNLAEAEGCGQSAHGRWQMEDRFLLMTDALAQWFLERTEQGDEPLTDIALLLTEPSPQEAFPGWVAEKRSQSWLRNDDVTLMVVDVLSA